MSEGRKDDQGKLRWRLLRHSMTLALESVLRVLSFGADKYGEENWKLVEDGQRRYRDALDRHLAEIDKGILVDPDTGEPHMAHVATNALFLLQLQQEEAQLVKASLKKLHVWRLGDPQGARPTSSFGLKTVEVTYFNGRVFRGHPRFVSWSQVAKWRPHNG